MEIKNPQPASKAIWGFFFSLNTVPLRVFTKNMRAVNQKLFSHYIFP